MSPRLRLSILLLLLAGAIATWAWPRAPEALLVHGEWAQGAAEPACPPGPARWTVAVTGDDTGAVARAFMAAAPAPAPPGAVHAELTLRWQAHPGWWSGLGEVSVDIAATRRAGACAARQVWTLALAVDQGTRGDDGTVLATAGRTVATHLRQLMAAGRL